MDENVNNAKGYIHDDVHGKPFFWFGVGFAVFSVLAVVVVTVMYRELTGYHERNQAAAPTRVATGELVPPGPQLQADPVADMVTMDTAQSALLASYGWVDTEKGKGVSIGRNVFEHDDVAHMTRTIANIVFKGMSPEEAYRR